MVRRRSPCHDLLRATRVEPAANRYPRSVPRSRLLRVLIALASVFALVAVGVVAVAATVIRRPLPSHSGTLDVPGLSADVTVLRDARGVPSIYAETGEDLFLAQGYVHAQDRFFEMDYRRHVTAGRLSELVGENPDALAADTVIRTFGWREVAEAEWELLSPDTQRYLQAYTDGVNAYLETRGPGALGVEYALLGLQVRVEDPEPWSPIDSIAWLKAMAWDLRANYDEEMERGLAYATVRDVSRVNELYPRYPYETRAPILPSAEPDPAADAAAATFTLDTTGIVDLERALAATREALAAVPHLLGEGDGVGSNSWAIAGEHTESGAPLLANDPHLSISAPGIWMQMGLYCTEISEACPFAVSGFTFAGFPSVIIGHNAELAWGLTNMGADVTDFFLERVDTDAGTYQRDGEQVPLDVRTEVIEVNGAEPVEVEVRSTVHGPIVSDALDLGRLAASPTDSAPRGRTEVALAWTALEPGRSADAVFMLATATGAEDLAEVARAFVVPSQNIVYATTDGDIGYQAPGRIPIRARVADGPVPSDGTWPRPGWDSRYDWQGYVDPAELPAGQNPPEGFIVAANQAVTDAGVGPFLTSDWDYGFRSQRLRDLITELIAQGTPIGVEQSRLLQNDVASPFAAALVPHLVNAPVTDEFTQEAIDLLREWDGNQEADSAAAAYFAAVWETLLELTFADDLPEELWPDGGGRWLEVVVGLLDDPGNPWWDDRRTVNVVESGDEILTRALETARLELTVELGKEPTDWQWGRVHTAAPQHAVLGGDGVPGPVRDLVNPRPLAVPGGGSIVNAMAWDAASGSFTVTAGPSMRMVVDLGDLDASTWVTLTGTSGHPGSVHYTDQFATWASGETYPWPFTPTAVEDASVRELTLRPAGRES